MNIQGYTESGSITIDLDSVIMTVPDDMGNRHRQMIAEWEAEGNTIPAYVVPASIPKSNEEILKEAMFNVFVDRMVNNTTAPATAKAAAVAYKAEKK